MNNECQHCKFGRWDAKSDYFILRCHYNAPEWTEEEGKARWPELHPQDFCGKFEERDREEKAL